MPHSIKKEGGCSASPTPAPVRKMTTATDLTRTTSPTGIPNMPDMTSRIEANPIGKDLFTLASHQIMCLSE